LNILEIEGIGPEYKKKLSAAGIDTIEDLLRKGASPKGRKEIEDVTGINPNLIIRWVYIADLIRIKGVGEEYSELLQAAGVNAVSDLAKRDSHKLFAKIFKINKKKNLVRQMPKLSIVEDWIEQAKNLPIIVDTGITAQKSEPLTQKRPISIIFIILFGVTFLATFLPVVITGVKNSPFLSISIPILIFGIILLIIFAVLFGVNANKNKKRAKGFKLSTLYTGIITFVALVLLIVGAATSPVSPKNSNIVNETSIVTETTVIEAASTSTVAETTQTSQTAKETASETTAKTVAAQAAETTAATTTETTATIPIGPLKVHFINVGQGDSILIQTPEGNTMLIDGGPVSSGSSVVSYLKNQGISKLNLIVSTHPHEDHIGGLINVINNFEVGNIIDSGVAHTTQAYKNYLSAIQSKNINFVNWSLGQKFDFGKDVSFAILGPTISSSDLNNSSIVIKLTYKNSTFLFAGDALTTEESNIISSGANLDSDVLKVGHHGSESSSSIKFLNAVSPAIAVISCGASNSYGHPHDITLKNLAAIGATIYRTDLTGTIVIESDGNTEKVTKGSSYTYVAKTVETTQVTVATQPTTTVPPETTAATETVTPETPASAGQYVGSIDSEVFHKPNCSYVKSILPENIVWYSSRDDAISQGKRPCKRCNP